MSPSKEKDALQLFKDGALTIAKRGREVVLIADTDEGAMKVFDWLTELGSEDP